MGDLYCQFVSYCSDLHLSFFVATNLLTIFFFYTGPISIPGVSPVSFSRPNNAAAAVPNSQQTSEMSIPNDLIGCIIGRAGQKINEIRYAISLLVGYTSSTSKRTFNTHSFNVCKSLQLCFFFNLYHVSLFTIPLLLFFNLLTPSVSNFILI